MNRELIFQTLADLMAEVEWVSSLKHTPIQFVTRSRRVRLFADVVSEQQPSCFQAEHDESTNQVTGMPYKSILPANWIVFQNVCRDNKAFGVSENNLILDAIDKVLLPKPSDPGFLDRRNTLGGLVHHCFVQGRIFKDPGDIDGQGMMVVPIKILVP